MTNELSGVRAAMMMANEGVEEVEFIEPRDALTKAGAEVLVVAPEAGEIQSFRHLDKSRRYDVDRALSDVRPSEFDALVLPGGVANPDQLRTFPEAVEFARAFFEDGKPVAVICHGPWTLVEADVVRDRTLTSWPSLRTDIRNAGGRWVDEEVQVCTSGPNVLVSSRKPDDLPAFCASIVDIFSRTRHPADR